MFAELGNVLTGSAQEEPPDRFMLEELIGLISRIFQIAIGLRIFMAAMALGRFAASSGTAAIFHFANILAQRSTCIEQFAQMEFKEARPDPVNQDDAVMGVGIEDMG